jgi:hypothetical protein
MRKFFFTLIIFNFLLLLMNISKAQTPSPKLNQVELMKQFLGTESEGIDQEPSFKILT